MNLVEQVFTVSYDLALTKARGEPEAYHQWVHDYVLAKARKALSPMMIQNAQRYAEEEVREALARAP